MICALAFGEWTQHDLGRSGAGMPLMLLSVAVVLRAPAEPPPAHSLPLLSLRGLFLVLPLTEVCVNWQNFVCFFPFLKSFLCIIGLSLLLIILFRISASVFMRDIVVLFCNSSKKLIGASLVE